MITWRDVKVGAEFSYIDIPGESIIVTELFDDGALVEFSYYKTYKHGGMINKKWVHDFGHLLKLRDVYLKKLIFRGQLAEL